MEEAGTRRVGIDLGKRTRETAIAGKNGKTAAGNGKTCAAGRQAPYRKLRPGDKAALEAGNMAFAMAKEIEAAVGCKAHVLNPSRLAVIYRSMKKTDKEDALKLAHILEDFWEERLPTAAVPSDEEMERRKPLSSYQREQGSRTRAINRLRALFVSQGITTMRRKDLARAAARGLSVGRLSGRLSGRRRSAFWNASRFATGGLRLWTRG